MDRYLKYVFLSIFAVLRLDFIMDTAKSLLWQGTIIGLIRPSFVYTMWLVPFCLVNVKPILRRIQSKTFHEIGVMRGIQCFFEQQYMAR